MLVVLLGLGTWQVQRLHWKESLIAEIDERAHEAPVDAALIPSFRTPRSGDPESMNRSGGKDDSMDFGFAPAARPEMTPIENADYHPAFASGLLQHNHEFYLHAISLTGEGGYHVLTPLQLDNGKYLLVNRGWVPYDRKLPETRADGQLFGPVTIEGILRVPVHHAMQPQNDAAKNDWYGIDLVAMAKLAGVSEFLPYVLDADAAPNPGGYPVGGQTRVNLPNNHFGYALTWYGLALALLVIYGVSATRKVS